MARPPRLEFAGGLYHVTSRGDRHKDIYLDDEDRAAWLEVVGDVCARFNWLVHAYCQMTNHYHLLVETRTKQAYTDWIKRFVSFQITVLAHAGHSRVRPAHPNLSTLLMQSYFLRV